MDPLNSPIETPKNLSSPFMNTRPKVSDGVPDTQKVNKAAEFRLLTKAMIEAQRPDSILERPRLKLPAIDLLDSNVTVARPASSDMSAAAVTKAKLYFRAYEAFTSQHTGGRSICANGPPSPYALSHPRVAPRGPAPLLGGAAPTGCGTRPASACSHGR